MSDGADSRQTYDRLGEAYARGIEDNAFNAHYERPATLSLLGEMRGRRVLDAGCGPGTYASLLADRGALVTGFDISPKMVSLARTRLGDRGRILEHDLREPLKFAQDQQFDFVISSLALHYLDSWEATLREFHRVLTAQGKLVVSIHHPLRDYSLSPTGDYFSTERLEEVWRTFGGPMPVRFYRRPLGAVFADFAAAGFRLEKMLEPFPTEECRRRFPSDYERLSRTPFFLCLRFVK